MRRDVTAGMVRFLAAVALCAAAAARADLVSDLESAPWIGDGRRAGDEGPAPEFFALFRRDVSALSGREVRFHIVCAGSYSLSVNGRKVDTLSQTSLMPLFSRAGSTLYIDTVRVPAEYFKAEDGQGSEVCILLGNGWYGVDASPTGVALPSDFPRGRPCFKFVAEGVGELEWNWRRSQVLRNSLSGGAVVDASRDADRVPKRATFVKGPLGRIVPCKAPAIDVGRTLAGESKWLKDGDVQVVDFGECRTGYPRFVFKAATRGRKVEIVYGERLRGDGSVEPLPAHAAPRDEYICRDGFNEFVPPFVWRSARFAEVRGASALLGEGDATWRVIHPRLEAVSAEGVLAAKGRQLSDLHYRCVKSLLDHMPGFVVDDPVWGRFQRGSTVAAVAEALAQNFDMREFFVKTLRDFADESERDGWIPESAPCVGGAAESPGGARGGTFESACAVPVLMESLFRHYNDQRAFDCLPTCLRYADVVSSKYRRTGVVGDVFAMAHWYRFLRIVEKLAALSPESRDQAARVKALADEAAARFAEKWISGDGRVGGGTAPEQVAALGFGLVPADLVGAAEKKLEAALEADGFAVPRNPLDARRVLLYLASHTMDAAAQKIASKMQADCESSPVVAAAVDEWVMRHAECGLE